MPFFLDPRPDELFYSVCARIQDAMRFTHKIVINRYLFGITRVRANIDIAYHLEYLVSLLPPGNRYTADKLIDECTLFPFYRPFLLPDQQIRMRATMRNSEDQDVRWLASMASSNMFPEKLRFCPKCVEEERTIFGDCYWHRLHQVPCVYVCLPHQVMLESSNVPGQNFINPYGFISAERAIQEIPAPRAIEATGFTNKMLISLAEDSSWILKHPDLTFDRNDICQKYRAILNDKGLASANKRVQVTKLRNVFKEFYPQELLGTYAS